MNPYPVEELDRMWDYEVADAVEQFRAAKSEKGVVRTQRMVEADQRRMNEAILNSSKIRRRRRANLRAAARSVSARG